MQERHRVQAGKIKGLLDYLFAERWRLDYAALQDKAHSVHQEEKASAQVTVLTTSLQQRAAAAPNYGPPGGQGRGGAGIPKRKQLQNGGFDLTHYPGARQAPKDCCRGWWLDGICNAIAGEKSCMFTHMQDHKGKWWGHRN